MEENKKRPAGFEETDVNVMAVGKFAVALVVMTVLAMLLLVGVFKYFQSQDGGRAASVDPARVFPQPQLQTTPIPDLKAIRAAEEDLKDSGRVVIRYSGTEALARVMIEAESEAQMHLHANAIADAIRTEIGV